MVIPRVTSMTQRFAAAVVGVLLVFVTVMPAVGACCVAKPGVRMTAMHASMPCCAEHCTLSRADAARNHDFTAVSAPSPDTVVVVVASIAELSSPANASIGNALIAHSSAEFSPPPPFLLHSQFRI